jgi:hypothetical protein
MCQTDPGSTHYDLDDSLPARKVQKATRPRACGAQVMKSERDLKGESAL